MRLRLIWSVLLCAWVCLATGCREAVCPKGLVQDGNQCVEPTDGGGGTGGTRSTCTQDASPADESCNNRDDDCDGIVDEGQLTAGPSQPTGFDSTLSFRLQPVNAQSYLMISSPAVLGPGGRRELWKVVASGAFSGAGLTASTGLPLDVRRLSDSTALVVRYRGGGLGDFEPAKIDARRLSVSGDPTFLGEWVDVTEIPGPQLALGNRVTTGASGEIVSVVGIAEDSEAKLQALRFSDAPAAVTIGPTTVVDAPDGGSNFSLATTTGPNVILAYPKDGAIRVAAIDKSTLTVVDDISVGEGGSPMVASNDSGTTALVFGSSVGTLFFVTFHSDTLRCVSDNALFPQSCVEQTGVAVEETTDLAFNGNHWLATMRFTSGWGIRALTDGGDVVGAFDGSENETPRVASVGNGSAVMGTISALRSFGCN